jgi:hypothetical protein
MERDGTDLQRAELNSLREILGESRAGSERTDGEMPSGMDTFITHPQGDVKHFVGR